MQTECFALESICEIQTMSQLFASNCWRFISTRGTDTAEIEIEKHQFGAWVLFWLVVFIWLPSSPVLVDQEVWWVPAFLRIAPDCMIVCHHHSGPKTSQSGKISSNLYYFTLMLWFSQGPKIQKILSMLSSAIFVQVYTILLHACWQTEFSSDLCGKVFTKSTVFVLFCFPASEKEELSI